MLKIEQLTCGYGPLTVVHKLDMMVEKGKIHALIGANGAGKTTAIKVLNGELKPTAGTIVKHPNLRLAYVAQHAFHHLFHDHCL